MSENDNTPADDQRMTVADQLTAGFLIDIAFGVAFLAASALVGQITVWLILVLGIVAAVWIWVRVMRRIRAADE